MSSAREFAETIWRASINFETDKERSIKWLMEYTEARDAALLRDERARKDAAYSERDQLVCAMSKLFPASLERHPDEDTSWENDWRWIVFIDLPTGQSTWHIHDSELAMFDHLPRFQGRKWDGHTTPEKYARLASLSGAELARERARLEEVRRYIKSLSSLASCEGIVERLEAILDRKEST